MEFRAEQFSIEFEHEKKWYPAVTDLNMHIDAGEMVALIGESGCGKSITALSMMGLQPKDTRLGGHLCSTHTFLQSHSQYCFLHIIQAHCLV